MIASRSMPNILVAPHPADHTALGDDGVMVVIRLLGPPSVERDGMPGRPLRGRKGWALLAYLLLADRPPSRAHLAQLLFADAEDPLGALRWTLAELRRGLGVSVAGDPVRLVVDESYDIDILQIRGMKPSALLTWSGELLEGLVLAADPEFESWLVAARHQVAAAVEARLRQEAVGLLAAGSSAVAVAYAARVVAINPLDEGSHELLVRSLALAGDLPAARRQVASCEDLFRRELGVAPSEALRDALDVGPASGMVRPISGRGAAVSQLEAGRAAIVAGAVDAGIQCLRRAVVLGRQVGDDALVTRSLMALGSALVHSVRGRDEEGTVVLREAVEAATRTGEAAMAASAYRELGFVEVQAGRRDTADSWLAQALAVADDDGQRAAILGVRGMNAADQADYPAAFVHLGQSVELARQVGDERQCAWSLSLIGRARLLRGERSQAMVFLDESLGLVTRQRWVAFQPWPQVLRGEGELLAGDAGRAADALELAWSLACQVGDPCWEGMAARGLGLLHGDRGDRQTAADWHGEAAVRANRTTDRYLWVLGYVLDASAGHFVDSREFSRAAPIVDRLATLAARTRMRELLVRAHLHRHRMGDGTALPAARMLAADIDNPALADALRLA
jgi:DNA-binding SARP family transcriptional activator